MNGGEAAPLRSYRLFVRFWIADGVSNLGSFVSALAIQLLLITTLQAGPEAIGLVRMSQWLPYLVFGMLAGVVVDRVRRKPLLVGADLFCAAVFGTIAALAIAGHLNVGLLAVLVFLAGSASMFFVAAHQSFLPGLVPPRLLPAATARIEQTYTAAQSAGPLVGGLLVRTLTAPVAIVVDAVSYAVSAALVATVGADEPRPNRDVERHLWRELKEGTSWVYRHRTLRPYAGSLHLWFFANGLINTVFVYFATTELRLDALAVGVVLAAAGVTGVLGAGLAPRLAERFGLGPVVVLAGWLSPAGYLLLLPAEPGPAAIVWPLVANLVVGLGMGLTGPLTMSHRTAVTPDRLRGRMNATIRSFNWGGLAVSAPLAGWLAASFGSRVAIGAGIVGLAASATWLTLSPYRALSAPGGITD